MVGLFCFFSIQLFTSSLSIEPQTAFTKAMNDISTFGFLNIWILHAMIRIPAIF